MYIAEKKENQNEVEIGSCAPRVVLGVVFFGRENGKESSRAFESLGRSEIKALDASFLGGAE